MNNSFKIFFIGIGGVSMSGLAKICKNFGVSVCGSDLKKTEIINDLLKDKIKVYLGHKAINIKKESPNLVVFTGAISNDNEEFLYAKQNNIKLLERSEFLGLICKNFEKVVAVAGTHGKTTTSAMIAEIFVKAGLKPTVHIGGIVKNFNNNIVCGENKIFITEACEYKRSFEKIFSYLSVVTNIDNDHLDCYGNMNALKNSFVKFVNNSKIAVLKSDCEIINKISTKHYYTCNFNNANYVAKDIKILKNKISFNVFHNENFVSNFVINMIGEYNVYNALLAICVAKVFNIETSVIRQSLLEFKGIFRRNEKLGEMFGCPIFADYCHHPTEIEKSILAYKNIYKKVLCVFQPHTYSRTKNLLSEFKNCFLKVDKLAIYKTFPAREKFDSLGSCETLFKNVSNKNKDIILKENDLLNYIIDEAPNFDCVLILGAGDLYDIVKNNLIFDNEKSD